MQLFAMFRDDIPRHLHKISGIESKILDSLITMESGNAYRLWKETKLKYYPTVLRTLKKLEEKNLVRIISKDGSRGETTYTPTLTGIFVFYILEEEPRKIFNFISENSTLFRELYKVQRDMNWMYSIIRQFFWSARREQPTIDEVVKTVMGLHIGDDLVNIRHNPEAHKDLMELRKIKWVKPLINGMIDSEIDRYKRELKALGELQKEYRQ